MIKKAGILVLGILFLASVNAGIILNEPMEIYNLGDRLYVRADGLIGADAGNLNIDLLCGNMSTNLVKISARAFSTEEAQSYSIPYKILTKEDLETENIDGIIGQCQVIASLGESVASTKTFTVSDEIVVTASVNKTEYKPGEVISVSIEAVKANGVLLNGFVEGNNASDFSKAIEEGRIVQTFSMPETIEAGQYSLNIFAYDVNQGILNQGNATIYFIIQQVPSSLVLSMSSESVKPGENFTVGVEIFDQSGKEMEGTVNVKVSSLNGELKEVIVNSKEFKDVDFESNASAGQWTVSASFEDISEERNFEVLEIMKAEFVFEDSVLVVKNIGNVKYNKTIEVNIGDEVTELELNMEVGEIRKFNLKAPEGEYSVSVGDGESNVEQTLLLTGKAISVKDFKEVGFFKSYSIVWVFLIIILGGVGIVLVRKFRKTKTLEEKNGFFKKTFGKVSDKIPTRIKSNMSETINFTRKSPEVNGFDEKRYSHEDKTMVDLTNDKADRAESSLVLKGEKTLSAVVALKIKNYSKLTANSKNSLIKAVNEVKQVKGLVDWKEDYVFIVFSPLVTRTYNNEPLAAKAGMALSKRIEEHNRKFRDKIEFNIGIHTGELISSKEKGKFKYTSIGNTIALAKKISDSGDGKVLVSDLARKKMMRELKVEKYIEIANSPVFKVSEIKNKEANEAKLKDLLKRVEKV